MFITNLNSLISKLLSFAIFFASILILSTAQAAASKEQFSSFRFKSLDGKTVKLSLFSYKNHLQEFEVRIEAQGMPGILKDLNPILGYGRDLNDNGKIDTWFFINSDGIKTVQSEGQDIIGRDVIAQIFKKEFGASFGLYTRTAVLSLFKHLLVSTSGSVKIEEEFYRDWIDLVDSDIRFKAMKEHQISKVTYTQTQFHYELQSTGYQELANKMDNFVKKEYWMLNALDAGLWGSGAVILKWLGAISTKIGISIGQSTLYKEVQAEVSQVFQNHLSFLTKKASQFKESFSKTKNVVLHTTAVQAMRHNWRNSNALMIKGMRSKNLLTRAFSKSLNGTVKFTKGAFSEWKYIVLNTSVQLGAETVAKYDEVYDENPFMMAQNVLEHAEIQQNVAFMASETILMTAASKNLEKTSSKFAVGGLIALTNSTQMNLLIKGEDDYQRVAVDTAWEVVIGNTQVQLDLMALAYFDKLAEKKTNPKIKLIGYAIVLVDMAVGYYGYSKLTDYIDEKNIALTPVFVHE